VADLPLPPPEFARRVGCLPDDGMSRYESLGAEIRAEIDARLPGDWRWDGKRVLDFGCGAGRVLRRYAAEAAVAEFHGCDLDPEMVAWVGENLCPPVAGAHANGPAPPLPFGDSRFDLIYATSVFTHIGKGWSEWLLEMHRLLAADGILIATFLGSGMSVEIAGEPWDEDRIAMNVLTARGGQPNVLHSQWWLREHWGRLFEFERLDPAGFTMEAANAEYGHGTVVLRPRPVSLSAAELEREAPGEPRYEGARRHHRRQSAALRRADRRAALGRIARRLRPGGARVAAGPRAPD
jgi:SAM-dependent methyltransferase